MVDTQAVAAPIFTSELSYSEFEAAYVAAKGVDDRKTCAALETCNPEHFRTWILS